MHIFIICEAQNQEEGLQDLDNHLGPHMSHEECILSSCAKQDAEFTAPQLDGHGVACWWGGLCF